MKRKITALLLVAVLVFALSGCMQITYHITLNENGTANAEYEMYMSNDYVSMIAGQDGGDPFAESKKSAEAAGFKVQEVKTEEKTGFKATAKNLPLNIEDMVNTVGMGGNATSDVQVKKGLFKNTYTLKANIDTSKIMGDDEQSQSMIPILNNAMDIKLIITAPSEIQSSTGELSTTQNNTYIYKIELGKNNEISLSYTLLNMTNMYIAGGIVLILLILLVFFLIKKTKKKQDVDDILTYDSEVNPAEDFILGEEPEAADGEPTAEAETASNETEEESEEAASDEAEDEIADAAEEEPAAEADESDAEKDAEEQSDISDENPEA